MNPTPKEKQKQNDQLDKINKKIKDIDSKIEQKKVEEELIKKSPKQEKKEKKEVKKVLKEVTEKEPLTSVEDSQREAKNIILKLHADTARLDAIHWGQKVQWNKDQARKKEAK